MAKKTVERTLNKLNEILLLNEPINPAQLERHLERKKIAKEYCFELELIIPTLPNDVITVPKNTFQKLIDKSDYVEIEEFNFVRVISVINYPEVKSRTYIWLMPISEI